MFHSSPMDSASSLGSIAFPVRALVIGAAAPEAPSEPNRIPDTSCERLLAATRDLERDGRLEVEFLISPSWTTLRVGLTDDRFDVVQVSGPFGHDPATGQPGLLVGGGEGSVVGAEGETHILPLARILTERADVDRAGLANGSPPTLFGAAARSASDAHAAQPSNVSKVQLVILDVGAGGEASCSAGEDLAQVLAAAGVPAIVTLFGVMPPPARSEILRGLYHGLCDGEDLASAVAPACGTLIPTGLSPFLPTGPMISGRVGGRLRLTAGDKRPAPPDISTVPWSRPPAGTAVRGRGPLIREAARRLLAGRVVVLYGPAGIGKSVVAGEAARRLMAAGAVEAVLPVNCAAGVTVDTLLHDLAASLDAAETGLDRLARRPMAPQHKAAVLADVLAARRILIVLDNAERLLVGASPHPQPQLDPAEPTTRVTYGDPVLAAGHGAEVALADLDLGGLLYQLIAAPASRARMIFTSREDFDPLAVLGRAGLAGDQTVGRLDELVAAMGGENALGPLPTGELHLALSALGIEDEWADRSEPSNVPPLRSVRSVPSVRLRVDPLSFEATVQITQGLPGLDALPVRAIDGAPSLRQISELAGGRPWALAHIAAWAARTSVADVLEALAGMPLPVSADQLLALSAARWPAAALPLLMTAALLDEPLPYSALARIASAVSDATGGFGAADFDGLVAGGWLVRRNDLAGQPSDGTAGYASDGPVRDWAARQIAASDRPAVWRAAARYWQDIARKTSSRPAELRAWRYLDLAGDAAAADVIVQRVWETLLTEGEVSLAVRLLGRSAATLDGLPRAVALDALAQTRHIQGDIAGAADAQAEALRVYERIGDWRLVVAALGRLGRLQQIRGAHDAARQTLERALSIAEGMGDPLAAARGLRQLGVIEQLAGRPDAALACFERALRWVETVEDRAEAMKILNQLGMFHEICGDDARAILRYEQALAIAATFGDAATMAGILHQLGLLHERAGEFDRAQTCYERSLALADKLDDRSGAALSLHQLGLLHRLRGDYDPARTCFQRSLAIGRRLGALSGMAGNLYQIGLLDELQGRGADARTHYAGALAAAEDAGDRVGMIRALGRLGPLCEEDGSFEQAVACAVRSMVVLNQMGSPDRDVAAGMLVRLRRRMAPESFDQAFRRSLHAADGTVGVGHLVPSRGPDWLGYATR